MERSAAKLEQLLFAEISAPGIIAINSTYINPFFLFSNLVPRFARDRLHPHPESVHDPHLQMISFSVTVKLNLTRESKNHLPIA